MNLNIENIKENSEVLHKLPKNICVKILLVMLQKLQESSQDINKLNRNMVKRERWYLESRDNAQYWRDECADKETQITILIGIIFVLIIVIITRC